MEYWSIGVMEYWRIRPMENWNSGKWERKKRVIEI
jgi:hypothetical protein